MKNTEEWSVNRIRHMKRWKKVEEIAAIVQDPKLQKITKVLQRLVTQYMIVQKSRSKALSNFHSRQLVPPTI